MAVADGARMRKTRPRRSFDCRWLLLPIAPLSFLQFRSLLPLLGVHHQLAAQWTDAQVALMRSANAGNTALVSLAAIPDAEKRFTPGVYKYGRNDTEIFVTGASLASDYDAHETMWFQFFAVDERAFNAKTAPNYGSVCRTNDKNHTLYARDVPALKPWDAMKEEAFHCRVGARMARLELMPSEGYDPNTNKVTQIWRCPLESILSDSDVQRMLHQPSEDVALIVEVLHEDVDGKISSVVQVHLPSTDPHVGLNRAKLSDPKRPFFQQRHNITLCMTSLANGLATLNEYIQYHHDVVGIDHIHLGLEARYNDTEDLRIVRIANSLLRPEIDAGRVTVSTLWDEASLGTCGNEEIRKQIFYQNCLYRAKSTSEFAATWDIDEYFLFTGEKPREKRLPDFLRAIDHPACPNWSYVTFKSATAGGKLPGRNYRTGLASLDFPLRENATNDVWQKSISRTKNVFLNSFHIPGSSLPKGKSNASDAIALHPNNGKCAFYVEDEEAMMIHVKGLMYRESQGLKEPTVRNELQSLLMSG